MDRIDVDFGQLKESKEKNVKEREWFIDYWVDYIKTHSDKEWSSQQNIVINGQFNN
ncbi:hypothetical protein M0R19_02535 [Candidatus Pacearchaeota archaeon]|nr:hypothetical protein [Candidatus Pacearchaeota archaeon]